MARRKLFMLTIQVLILLIFSSTCNANLLHEAVEANDLPKVTKLLNEGVFQGYIHSYKCWGDVTPLDLACILGYTKMAKLLLDSHKAPSSRSLNVAISYGPIEIVKLLLDYGAHVNPVGDVETPLRLAILAGNVDKMRLLLERGAKIKDFYICRAIITGRLDAVQLLLEYGAKIDDDRFKELKSMAPLHVAVNVGNVEMATFLLENKADVNVKDELGETPLHYAAKAGNERMIKLLLDYKADINATDREGVSAFSIIDKEIRGIIEAEEGKERKELFASPLAMQLKALETSLRESEQRRAIIAEEQVAARRFSTSIPAYFRLLADRFEQAYFFSSEIRSRDAHSMEEEDGLQGALRDEHHTKLVQRSVLGKRVFGTDTPTCPICHAMCAYNQEVVITKCGHMFHPGCFREWYKGNRCCPCDRTPLAATEFPQYRLAIAADSKSEKATAMPE